MKKTIAKASAKSAAILLFLAFAPVPLKAAPVEAKNEAEMIKETFQIVDSMGLRTMLGIFGVALRETISPTDPNTYIDNIRKALPGESANAFIDLHKREEYAAVKGPLSDIDQVALVAIDWMSPKAFGFTFLAVGTKGPIAFEIQTCLAPKQKPGEVTISSIKIHSSWEDIRDLISAQKKLPTAITINGSFKKQG